MACLGRLWLIECRSSNIVLQVPSSSCPRHTPVSCPLVWNNPGITLVRTLNLSSTRSSPTPFSLGPDLCSINFLGYAKSHVPRLPPPVSSTSPPVPIVVRHRVSGTLYGSRYPSFLHHSLPSKCGPRTVRKPCQIHQKRRKGVKEIEKGKVYL